MAKKIFRPSFFVAHVFLIAYILLIIYAPTTRKTTSAVPLFVAIALIEITYIVQLVKMAKRGEKSASSEIITFVWILMFLWELFTTKLNMLSVVTFPSPEKVFYVFVDHYQELALNALYSTELLIVGFLGGIFLGAALGIVVGWFKPIRGFVYPVARVLAPIPPMIISPYVILIMPTFRAASIVLVGITTFMFVFLSTIEEVSNVDQEILDSSRMLNLDGISMVKDILVPYVMPGVIGGLKLYLIMGFMMLIYGETMGSTYGLGHWICINHTVANYSNLIAGFIEIGVLVVIINKLAEIVQKKVIVWK